MLGIDLNVGPFVVAPLQGGGDFFSGRSRAFSPGYNMRGFQPSYRDDSGATILGGTSEPNQPIRARQGLLP